MSGRRPRRRAARLPKRASCSVATYEPGHQPLHVASPAAALRKAGHEVRCLDLSVERWETGALEWAQALGFSVPMHTAKRLAMRAAAGVRRARPELPVCFYGLYAREYESTLNGVGRRAGGRRSARRTSGRVAHPARPG